VRIPGYRHRHYHKQRECDGHSRDAACWGNFVGQEPVDKGADGVDDRDEGHAR
jgi:hypothetical protein